MNVLITSLSRKVPLLKAIRQALSTSAGGGLVWGADSDPECVGRYFVDRFWNVQSLENTSHAFSDFCAKEEIDLLIPTRDGELAFFATMRDQLAEQGTYTPVGTLQAINVCLDKLSFHDHCLQEGIPTVPTSTTIDALEGERFVVKDRRGAGGRDVAIGLDRHHARAHGQRFSEPIFQPVLDGTEHSIDVYVNRRGEVVEVAPRMRIRIHDGESTVTETVDNAELVAAAVRFAESLDLRGHLVIQAFVHGRDVTLVECNPRVGGASTLGFHAGVESPRWAMREALGEVVEPRIGAYRRGLRLVRYPVDLLVEH